MSNLDSINLSHKLAEHVPFPHFYCTTVLQNNICSSLFEWFEQTNEWHLIETDFYEQYEFNFLSAALPNNLQTLVSEVTIANLKNEFKAQFNLKTLDLVGVVAHKLINNQHIGIHNDFINGEETHRLVIHVNPNWKDENGGFLMLFNSSSTNDLAKIIKPVFNSAFGFEISNKSYHAVSKINNCFRYTIIYTFRAS